MEDEMEKATLLKTLTEARAAWEALLAQIGEEEMQTIRQWLAKKS
jgi:hypothetical protein